MVAGSLVFNAIEEIMYKCKPPVDPYVEWCEAPFIAYLIATPAILFGPWLVATYLLARREAIFPSFGSDGSGITIGWFGCVFMGLMWWLAFVVLTIWEAPPETAP